MGIPAPVQGLVVRYSYLWRAEYLLGHEEGVKDRPCAVILVTKGEAGHEIVTVLPITHAPPLDSALAIEIPLSTKRRIGLDDARSWVVLSEANRFIWPGPDLRPRVGAAGTSVVFAQLPFNFMNEVRVKFIALLKSRRVKPVPRTD